MRLKGLIVAIALLAAACGGGGAPPATGLVLVADQSFSDLEDAPRVVGAFASLRINFFEPLDGATVPGHVTLQAARPGGTWVDDPAMDVVWNAGSPADVVLQTRDGRKLPEGSEYRLRVTTAVRSTSGKTLAQDWVGYLAIDYTLDLATGIDALKGERSVLYVVSDIHMGDARGAQESLHRYGWFVDNQVPLGRFLDLARTNPNLKELVVAGDMFDGWVVPMNLPPLGEHGALSSYLDDVAAANPGVMSAFRNLMDPEQVTVTWVPGNHDMLFDPADVSHHLPKIQHARDRKGLGAYTPASHPEIVVEHGHRYDFFSAPDPISNLDITGGGSILPPGFWVSRVAASSVAELDRHPFPFLAPGTTMDAREGGADYTLYGLAWLGILARKPVLDPWCQDVIRTGIDGYTRNYAILDLLPYPTLSGWDVNLYRNVEESWIERQRANGVAVQVPKEIAMTAALVGLLIDAQSNVQYFANPASNRRIVVFGHTHEVNLATFRTSKGQAAIYANSGTWADRLEFGKDMTFVVIVPPPAGAVVTVVSTYTYEYEPRSDTVSVKKIASAAARI